MPVGMGFVSILAGCSRIPLHHIAGTHNINKIGDILIYVIRCKILDGKSGGILICKYFVGSGNMINIISSTCFQGSFFGGERETWIVLHLQVLGGRMGAQSSTPHKSCLRRFGWQSAPESRCSQRLLLDSSTVTYVVAIRPHCQQFRFLPSGPMAAGMCIKMFAKSTLRLWKRELGWPASWFFNLLWTTLCWALLTWEM